MPLFLNEQALAVWIMDDGTGSGYGLRIAAHCFQYDDLLKVQTILEEKYGLVLSLHPCGKDQFGIYVHAQSMPALAKRVQPYMVENIMYKLGKYGSSSDEDSP